MIEQCIGLSPFDYQRTPLGEREAIAAGRNLTSLLRETGAEL
jgi:hypothetical protein